MTGDELYQDITNEFRRMGFAQHSSAEPPSGLVASVGILSQCEEMKMNKVTLGKFEVGQTVKPRNPKSYGGNRRGKVVEVTPNRIRVLWEKQANGVMGKRTWMDPKNLVQVVEGAPDPFPEPQPAVGPGGWCLDTND